VGVFSGNGRKTKTYRVSVATFQIDDDLQFFLTEISHWVIIRGVFSHIREKEGKATFFSSSYNDVRKSLPMVVLSHGQKQGKGGPGRQIIGILFWCPSVMATCCIFFSDIVLFFWLVATRIEVQGKFQQFFFGLFRLEL
jgi:hypothetical protein